MGRAHAPWATERVRIDFLILVAALSALPGCGHRDRGPRAQDHVEPVPDEDAASARSIDDDPHDAAPSTPERRPGAFANLDPSDDTAVGPPDALPGCEERLTRAGVTFRAAKLPVHVESKIVCGAPQVVTYLRGPENVVYDPSPLLTCAMALAMASFERILQEEANRIVKSPVVRIEQLGTYNCRGIAAYKGVVSEHAYANAIDLARFTLKNGRSFTVLNDFDSGEGVPARPSGALLRSVSQRSYDEDVFSNVLTPFWDAHHNNHFHLDLARYRVDGVRPGRP